MHRRIDYAAVLLNLLQLLVDLTASLSGFYAAFWLYTNTDLLTDIKREMNRFHTPIGDDYYLIATSFAILVLVSFAVKHLYQSRETGLMNMDEATSVLQGLFAAAAAVIIGNYIFIDPHTTRISRLIVGMGVAISCLLVLAGRAFGFKIRRYLQRRGHFFRRVIICGAGEAGRSIARKLLHSPKFHILPVAFLDDDRDKQGKSIDCLSGHAALPVVGRLHDIDEALERFDAHEVWIAITGLPQEKIIEIAQLTGESGVPCRFVPNLYQIPLETLSVESLAGVPLLSIKPRATVRPMPISKRAFDILFSGVVLLSSLPLFPLLVALIRLTSRGPAIFAQQRVGQGGRIFTMYKFRTMFSEAPAYAVTPRHSADARITPVGRWLRKLSIDELPQFWNVLVGDMSVVGPRPEMPQIVALYTPIQRQRLSVKPGITGVWQISADRKNPIHENIDYDLYYIEKQSFFMDLMIIVTTGFYGARGV
ncbi:MAG TPA: sugar transferase [Planctomycetota bacterium]|nr:sugar transferase [Planctomycetota bacterium]